MSRIIRQSVRISPFLSYFALLHEHGVEGDLLR
jgi:hypothetical protein